MLRVVPLSIPPPVAHHGAYPARRTDPRQPLRIAFRGGAILAQWPRSWDNYNHSGAKVRMSCLAKDGSLGTFAPSYQIQLKKNTSPSRAALLNIGRFKVTPLPTFYFLHPQPFTRFDPQTPNPPAL